MKTANASCNNMRLMTPSAQKAGSGMESITSVPGIFANWAKVLALPLFLSTALIASAENYSIGWYKVAGGGGTSSSAVYSVSGTIGQHDAGGPLVGGDFSLTGGFWSFPAVQTPGAPALRIVATSPNTLMVYWPSPSTGFNLQVKTDLTSASWTAPTEIVQDNGTIKYILVSPTPGQKFYRLNHP
jgi:hypothetical protein